MWSWSLILIYFCSFYSFSTTTDESLRQRVADQWAHRALVWQFDTTSVSPREKSQIFSTSSTAISWSSESFERIWSKKSWRKFTSTIIEQIWVVSIRYWARCWHRRRRRWDDGEWRRWTWHKWRWTNYNEWNESRKETEKKNFIYKSSNLRARATIQTTKIFVSSWTRTSRISDPSESNSS